MAAPAAHSRPIEISFRALAQEDLPLLYRWLGRPHVSKWYASAPASFAEVSAKYSPRTVAGNAVRAYIVLVDGIEAGYIQTYRLDEFPAYRDSVGADGAVAGLDLFIGDEWRTGRGLGSEVIRRFVERHVFDDAAVTACIASPPEGNENSARAFEKAGFRRCGTARNERGENESVLRLDRHDAACRLEPIDLQQHADICIAFRRDQYAASFGDAAGLEEEMGEGNALYLSQLRSRIAQVPEGNVHLWHGERIVGQAELRLLEDEPQVGYVSLFYVAPECRGKGFGRLLHEHAARVFKARGMRAMRLSVSSRNHAAIAFYRKLGWKPVGTRPNKEPMSIMEFRLA